ncbi:MAG: triose-phosphate isomerase [Chloroflexota bacterium]|nr:triose-phosphate isomerase [Chloroflexota bacterium]
MRPPIIVGNWKMNPTTRDEAIQLALAVQDVARAAPSVTAVICPPTLWLTDVHRAVGRDGVAIGAQTMHFEERGAFTGETSPLMLEGLVEFVIVGHSERRLYEGETDERVGRKVVSAVAHGLRPIAAVGERAEERRAGETVAVIDRQVRAAIASLAALGETGLVIAYEPVWAIGTGDAASAADAQEVCAQIRHILRDTEADAADAVQIQYGGSVTAENAAELFAQPDIDGALVGGASLKPDQFAAILRAAALA